jgi:hypothetical protein
MRSPLIFMAGVLICMALSGWSHAQDAGVPDTFYIEIHPQDKCISGVPPYFVRFPIYITHDIVDPAVDSIAGIQAPLCYEHSNTTHYCSLSSYWNKALLYPGSGLDRSIFRHYISGSDTLEHNWFMDQSQKPGNLAWDFVFVDVEDGQPHFWMILVPTGSEDQKLGDCSRRLIATMTFKLEDTTTIEIENCVWPPDDSRIIFSNSSAESYMPVFFLPLLETVTTTERGDANGDGIITVSDALYLLNYLFHGGPPPVSFVAGDADSDGDLGVLDPIFLLNYLYKGGRPPGC